MAHTSSGSAAFSNKFVDQLAEIQQTLRERQTRLSGGERPQLPPKGEGWMTRAPSTELALAS